MRCKRCSEPGVIDIRRHNASFCAPCFLHYCKEQVRKTIKEHSMILGDEKVLVAVSGGKDSLALWDILVDLGYEVDGLYLALGIGEYSQNSHSLALKYAHNNSLKLIEQDVQQALGFSISDAPQIVKRAPCSACGTSKRHFFNSVALKNGYEVLATGHNLDDEAAVLMGNVLRWDLSSLSRQSPCLSSGNGFVRKIKPLIRLSEREMAAYCIIKGIDYIVQECPMSKGNRHIGLKEALNAIEDRSPGTKSAFYLGFLSKALDNFKEETNFDFGGLKPCRVCESPTPSELCAFCRLSKKSPSVANNG